jgi:hypothetical protein
LNAHVEKLFKAKYDIPKPEPPKEEPKPPVADAKPKEERASSKSRDKARR